MSVGGRKASVARKWNEADGQDRMETRIRFCVVEGSGCE
ncbi:hypothetical protein AQPE_4610 [Aquipluma nitroreducens]|uniref:Uncharacterized protein n=1 Tax=Aquipluma nitroreducens TaxID=2010828 RepID=A0A5K7SFQ5_9BACT|nr:hypothetical protein AQPE_4610 [Aquipluma nitroreducens]